MMPPEVEVMTLEMKINLMAPASGRLRAEGRVLKAGRRISVVAADVWAEDNAGQVRQVAAVHGTMIPVDRTPVCCFPAIHSAQPSCAIVPSMFSFGHISEVRRVGIEFYSPCRSRGSSYPYKKNYRHIIYLDFISTHH